MPVAAFAYLCINAITFRPHRQVKLLSIIAVFAGSGLGGVCRYLLGRVLSAMFGPTLFPWATFAVNIAGCFILGLLYGIFERQTSPCIISPELRLLLTVGFCGGFTTFSTFINENYLLFQSSHLPAVAAYTALSLTAGFILLYAGYALGRA